MTLTVHRRRYRCTGSFGSMEEALPPLAGHLADVALIDIGLPGISGIDGMRRLRERRPDLRMVALTVYQDDDRILLAEGHSYKTAAATLGSSVHTVDAHLRKIYQKLEVHSKSEAVAKALRDRLVR